MASDRATAPPRSFADATRVEKLDSHHYRVHLDETFCIGNVPNGGYTAACILAVASAHGTPRNQADTMTAHFEYANRARAGVAIVAVDDVKLGRQLSTLHLTLWQLEGDDDDDDDGLLLLSQRPWINNPTPGSVSRPRRIVLAYATQTNLRTFTGLSIPTGFETTSSAAAARLPWGPLLLPDFGALREKGRDANWEVCVVPEGPARTIARSTQKWHFYTPRQGPLVPGQLDVWTRLASGERIGQAGGAALAYVVDSFPYNMFEFLAAPELRERFQANKRTRAGEEATAAATAAVPNTRGTNKDADANANNNNNNNNNNKPALPQRTGMWFPTVVLNLEVKAALPEEGLEWLCVRATAKQIRNGRFDLDVSVRDVDGNLVALSNHVAMMLSIERNMKKPSGASSSSL